MSWQDVQALQAWLQPWVLGTLGLCIGSFLNVVAHRMPLMMERQWWADIGALLADTEAWRRAFGVSERPSALQTAAEQLESAHQGLKPLTLSKPRSRCPACGHQIRWFENIPLLSYLALRGKCRACGTRIRWRYPAVEAMTGLLFFAIGWRYGATFAALAWCGVAAVLVAASLIDWDTTLLPDDLTLPLLWTGLLASIWHVSVGPTEAILGAVIGYGALWAVAGAFQLLTGKQGMGQGDFKLLAALGAWLGPMMLLPIVLMSSLVGAVVGLLMKAQGSLREGRYVPFGPFLAAAGLIVVLVTPAPWRSWLLGGA